MQITGCLSIISIYIRGKKKVNCCEVLCRVCHFKEDTSIFGTGSCTVIWLILVLDRFCITFVSVTLFLGVLARKIVLLLLPKKLQTMFLMRKGDFSSLTEIALMCNIYVLEVISMQYMNTWYSSYRSVQLLLNFPAFKCFH